MDHVATLARGKRFVELGSRNGDLIDCVSRFTASAVSIEADPDYCRHLSRRAIHSHGRFTSLCFAFPDGRTPDADIFYAWINHYLTLPFLKGLRGLQDRGVVRAEAQFALFFSGKSWPKEWHCAASLKPFADSVTRIPFDEGPGAREHCLPDTSDCPTVAVFIPSRMDFAAVEAAERCSREKATEHVSSELLPTRGGRSANPPRPSLAAASPMAGQTASRGWEGDGKSEVVEHAKSYDVAIIGAGPNALRLLLYLKEKTPTLRTVSFERGRIGQTIAMWYEGSVSHSPRHMFQVGHEEPEECNRCLDEVYSANVDACTLDGGKRRHCGRDEYVNYLRRVAHTNELPIQEHERVLSVVRNTGSKGFTLTTCPTTLVGGWCTPVDARRLYRAQAVVLAIGSASNPRTLPGGTLQGRNIANVLGAPSQYSGKHVVVIGSGPSGMESAVRLCSKTYGATHVTMVSRSAQLLPPKNVYLNESIWRINSFVEAKKMSVLLGTSVSSVEASHATVRLPSGNAKTIPADYIISALGFTTDERLVRSLKLPDGNLSAHFETSVPGLFNLGVANIAPWGARVASKLGTFIEDSLPKVEKVCHGVLRHLGLSVPKLKGKKSWTTWCTNRPDWRPGFCASASQPSTPELCATGTKGTWSDVDSAEACSALCQGCERCTFVAYSPKDHQCTWNKNCKAFDHLHTGEFTAYCTRSMK